MDRRRRLTTTLAGIAVLVLTLGLTGAGPAAAAPRDGANQGSPHAGFGPWTPAPDLDPIDVPDCGTTVTFDEAVTRVQTRSRDLPDGTVETESKGKLRLTVVRADTGESILVDASGASTGPFSLLSFPNGDFEFRATGNNVITFPPGSAPMGFPTNIVEHGPIDLLFHAPLVAPDGSQVFSPAEVRQIGRWQSVCDLFDSTEGAGSSG